MTTPAPAIGLLPEPGSHAGVGGLVLGGAFCALMVVVVWRDTKGATGVWPIFARSLVVGFVVLALVSWIYYYDDMVWFPPE